ncbi:MAG: phosphoesterase [Gammaproteobacteria bacterium]|nr:phosphoesterase [Gammaproteobacteria bacterium]
MADFPPTAHWRDSARSPRFFMIDARASFSILLFLLHISATTGMFVVVSSAFFSILEHFGFSLPVFFRWVRVFLAGPIRISQPWWFL